MTMAVYQEVVQLLVGWKGVNVRDGLEEGKKKKAKQKFLGKTR